MLTSLLPFTAQLLLLFDLHLDYLWGRTETLLCF